MYAKDLAMAIQHLSNMKTICKFFEELIFDQTMVNLLELLFKSFNIIQMFLAIFARNNNNMPYFLIINQRYIINFILTMQPQERKPQVPSSSSNPPKTPPHREKSPRPQSPSSQIIYQNDHKYRIYHYHPYSNLAQTPSQSRLAQSPPLHFASLFTTDLYQFTCSYSYYQAGKCDQLATFQVFFRKYPFNGKYVVLGGIRAVKEFMDRLQFTREEEEYLREKFPHMEKGYFQWIRTNLKKNIKIKSMKQGEIVFAKQPIISYTGPISLVQLFQTPILNLIGFASLVITNASRMAKVVEPKKCVEFGIRRAQGPDGGLSASQFAYLGGFIGTSNVYASQKLNIPCYGTMSHAYVTSFSSLSQATDFELNSQNFLPKIRELLPKFPKTHQGELASFVMFAKAFPDNFVTLIDTYSTLKSGILNTIIVAKVMVQAGYRRIGIRLDSGDLAKQSIQCRKIWNEHFPQGPRLNILASDDLHQDRLVEMVDNGNQIDTFAIGTHIATCKKQPALGLVCKLVQLDGQPKLKLSQDIEKSTLPCNKSVYRVWTAHQQEAEFDLLALNSENLLQSNSISVIDSETSKAVQVQVKALKLLNTSWDEDSWYPPYKTLEQCREHFDKAKREVKKVLDIVSQIKAGKGQKGKEHQVRMSEGFYKVFKLTVDKNKAEMGKREQSQDKEQEKKEDKKQWSPQNKKQK